MMDVARFADLGLCMYRLMASACILLSSPSCSAANDAAALQFKVDLKDKIVILLKDTKNDM